MNKKFLSAILFGALVVSTGSFVSCANNDDDIKQLQDQNSELKTQLAQLKSELQAELKNAANASQVAAIEAKLSAIESATAENLQATINALKGNFETPAARLVALETQLKALKGLEGVNVSEVVAAINKAKENATADFSALSAMIDEIDADLNVLETAVRALVFQPEFYLDGIEAAEYTYLRYVALDDDRDTFVAEKKNYDGNPVAIKDGFKWQYAHRGDIQAVYEKPSVLDESSLLDKSEGWGALVATGKNVPNTVQFAVNPSNAKLSLDMIIKNVCAMTRADEASVIYAKEIARENGIVTVQYEIENPLALITANNVESSFDIIGKKANTSVFKLVAASNNEQAVESDWGVLYETAVQPVAIALNEKSSWNAPIDCTGKFNELHKNPYEALADKPTFALAYNDEKGVNMAENIEIHMIKMDVEKTGATSEHFAVSLADAAAKYGLTYEFIAVPYTADGNVTEPTNYSTMTDGTGAANVVANIVSKETGAPEVGVQGESSVGKQPLYQVLVKKGDDVVLDAYIKIIIARQVEPIISEELPLGQKAYDCKGLTFTSTWYQFSTIVLQNAVKMSKEEFVAKYKLEVNSANEAIQYSAPGTKKADLYTAITEVPDPLETTNNVLTFALDEYAQQYIIEDKEGMADVIYVKYVSQDDRYQDMGIDPEVYVPLAFSLTNPAKIYTYEKKNVNFWYAADGTPNITPDEALRFNVNYPEDGKNTKSFVRDINDAWEGKTLKLSGASSTTKQYYFHPATNGVVVTDEYSVPGEKYEYTLSVESDEVLCHKWNANHTLKVENNLDSIEQNCKVYVGYGIYNNNVLKATYNKVTEVIATLNQVTGEVVYKNDSELAKRVLNAVSHKNAEAKAYVGIVAADACDHAIAVENGVFPVYFLRPIDIEGVAEKKVVDAKANADFVSLFDMFKFTDWRDVEFFNKEANDYKNVWLLAYYNVNTITVDTKNILTNMNQADAETLVKLSSINADVKISYVDHNKVTVIADGKKSINMTPFNKESKGVKSTYTEIVDHFGYIKYENKGANVSDFKVVIPVEFAYDWGTIKKNVTIYVEGSMANHDGE